MQISDIELEMSILDCLIKGNQELESVTEEQRTRQNNISRTLY
jgi:hypothetical protein